MKMFKPDFESMLITSILMILAYFIFNEFSWSVAYWAIGGVIVHTIHLARQTNYWVSFRSHLFCLAATIFFLSLGILGLNLYKPGMEIFALLCVYAGSFSLEFAQDSWEEAIFDPKMKAAINQLNSMPESDGDLFRLDLAISAYRPNI